MMMTTLFSRRRLLQGSLIAAGSGILAACGGNKKPSQTVIMPSSTSTSFATTTYQVTSNNADNTMRIFASSGFCEDPNRIQTGLDHLTAAGFVITNHAAAYRRWQRFAGSDAERATDLQDVATGRVPTPKVLMGARGGYGAIRILPHVDWINLGARMKEHGTLLFGFSDVTAIQLALLSQGLMCSFAGPMLYSEFAKSTPNTYTMNSFIQNTTSSQITLAISSQTPQQRFNEMTGILWGGNLSVLASLVGTPYMPKIQGGLLFLEDVSEQPYRIERMLQTLHLAGILKQQQAIILGDFRMGNIRDTYDASYDLNTVAQTISRVAGIPVLTDFPFGHIANKTTFPLGASATLRPDGLGYAITFSHYPTLNERNLNLSALLPPPVFDFTNSSNDGSLGNEVLE